MTPPFQYPRTRHIRKHGPRGYASYALYRPWLRDEFSFRCVFCWQREVWVRHEGTYAIDHFEPVTLRPELVASYDNLLYCCTSCNSVKGSQLLPDPLKALVGATIRVHGDGTVEALTAAAEQIVSLLYLNDPNVVAFRRRWIRIIALAQKYDPPLYQELMGFPSDLPNLDRCKPPGGNSRRSGVRNSYFAQRRMRTLPATY